MSPTNRDAPFRRAGSAIVPLALVLLALGCGGRKAIGVGVDGAAGASVMYEAGRDMPDAPSEPAAADGLDARAPDGGDAPSFPFGCIVGNVPVHACNPDAGPPNAPCGSVCGNQCVALATNTENCGRCGVACKPQAACIDGVCGPEPTVLVPPAPGCLSIRLAAEPGQLTWADVGHGTIKRIATAGGAVTTLASSLRLAMTHLAWSPADVTPSWRAVPIIVRGGTVFFVTATEPARFETLEGQDCTGSGDASVCRPNGQTSQVLKGGKGTAIQSVTAGSAPKTLLPPELAPATPASPDGGAPHAASGIIGPIALSPDGKVLYFADGPRFYRIPSAGAVSSADVELVGFTRGPEESMATFLVADSHRLFFPTLADDWIEVFDLAAPCDATMAANRECPKRIGGSHANLLADPIVLNEKGLTWAIGSDVRMATPASLSLLSPSAPVTRVLTSLYFDPISAIAVGPTRVYLAESPDGFIERGSNEPPPESNPQPNDPKVIARGQKDVRFLELDGANVFWTTSACDIRTMADAPQ